MATGSNEQRGVSQRMRRAATSSVLAAATVGVMAVPASAQEVCVDCDIISPPDKNPPGGIFLKVEWEPILDRLFIKIGDKVDLSDHPLFLKIG